MDLNEIINIILIVCCIPGIFFALPSTVYTAMFLGIFHRQKPFLLDENNLEGTGYYPYRNTLKEIISEAKQLDHEPITIESNDHLKLTGRYYNQNASTTVLLVHGYQSNAFNNFSSLLKYYLSLKCNVLMVDQRAHGSSDGRFTTAGQKEQYDLINWISWIDSNTDSVNIFLHGMSMGATTIGLSSDKISNPKVKGLIMEAGFTSFYEELVWCTGKLFMKKALLNYLELCAKHLLKVDIRQKTTESLSKTSIPVLFLHGDSDVDVAISNTEENFQACASEKSLLIVEGAGHTLCHLIGKEKVESAISEFINKYQV